jgi:imidazolonepropionase-like amidohydrolase
MSAPRLLTFVWAAVAGGEASTPRPAPARLVLKAAHVVLSPGKAIPRGVIVIEDGKIAAVGTDLGAPQGARILDYGDATISAGLVDARAEIGAEGETVDTAVAFTPAVRAADAFRRGDRTLARAAEEGITTIGLAPEGRNVASGIAGIVKAGRPGRIVKDEAYSLFSFDEMALSDTRFPTSLAAALGELGRRLREAGADPAKAKDPEAKALARAHKDLRPWIEVPDPDAFREVWKLCQDAKITPVILATGDLTDAAVELGHAKIPLALHAVSLDSTPAERRAPALFAAAGVELAFVTGRTGGGVSPNALRVGAALAAASGLDRNVAFAAITTHPAQWLGLAAQAGTIEAGRDADLVVWSGDPMNLASSVRAVLVDGALVERGAAR